MMMVFRNLCPERTVIVFFLLLTYFEDLQKSNLIILSDKRTFSVEWKTVLVTVNSNWPCMEIILDVVCSL
jgi:hypothetical protein